MIKKLLCLLLPFCFVSCKAKDNIPNFSIDFFYKDSCEYCNAFKEKAIPYFESRFQDKITINYYNIEDEDSKEYYSTIIDRLDNFDDEWYENVPFIVLDPYFALLGYGDGEEKLIADDFVNALNNKPLSKKLELYRYNFKVNVD